MSASALEKHARLRFAPDKVTAEIAIAPECPREELTREGIEAILDGKAVSRQLVDDAAIDEIIETFLAQGEDPEEIVRVVATGEASVPGTDGELVLSDAISARVVAAREVREAANGRRSVSEPQQSEPEESEESVADYYSRSAFVVVERGELLGKLREPQDGIDGLDVFGRAISASKGKRSSIALDDTVKVSRNSEVHAAIPGELRLNEETLTISPILNVKADVNFSVGNVVFPGDVDIRGGVKDRFKVKAGGRLIVRGLIEAATIESAGDAEFGGGLAGRGKADINVSGSLSSRYLDSATVAVGGDCHIEREINACSLHVGGEFISPRCSVRGGSVSVLRGISVGRLGGEGDIATKLTIGYIPELNSQLAAALQHLPALEEPDTQRQSRLSNLEAQGEDLSGSEREEIMVLGMELAERADQAAKLRQVIQAACKAMIAKTASSVEVHDAIFPGVTIGMRGWKINVRNVIKGPFRIEPTSTGRPELVDPSTGTSRPFGDDAGVTPVPNMLDPYSVLSELAKPPQV
ncbi:MAG: FapA family protein, partial [Planctomycetota bacterium]